MHNWDTELYADHMWVKCRPYFKAGHPSERFHKFTVHPFTSPPELSLH